MGRIKSAMVKKAAKQLVGKENMTFNEDFENNKKILKGLLPSKPIQNKVAGYISRLMKMQRIEKQRRLLPVAAIVSEQVSMQEQ